MSTTTNTYLPQTAPNEQKPVTQTQPEQPGYVQQAYDGAASLATSAANTLSGVLGGVSTANPLRTQPSETTYRNQQPHVGGVGDLGTTSEVDVTRLPEERANPDPLSGGPIGDIAHPNPAYNDPGLIQKALNTKNEKSEPGFSGAAIPKENQYRNQQPHVGGVADLGTNSSADVARLPEERVNPNPLGDQYRNHQPHVGGVGDLGTRSEQDVARLPEERGATSSTDKPSASQEAQRSGKKSAVQRTVGDITHPDHSGGVSGSNHDNDHGLGAAHGEEHGGRDERAVRGTQDKHHEQGHDSKHHDKDDEGDDAKSPTMKDKIKGSLHVVKGKITRDKEEVAQGKLLKTTGQTESPTSGNY